MVCELCSNRATIFNDQKKREKITLDIKSMKMR